MLPGTSHRVTISLHPVGLAHFSFNFQADVTNCRLENITGSAHEKLKDTDLVGACRYADKDPTEGHTSPHLMPSSVDPATLSKMTNDKMSVNQDH